MGIRGKTLWLATCESCTLESLAALFVRLGAVEALYLDGGGSTSLVVRGERVAGGTLRVPNHVAVRCE